MSGETEEGREMRQQIEIAKKVLDSPQYNVCNGKYGKEKEASPIFSVLRAYCATFSVQESFVEHPDE